MFKSVCESTPQAIPVPSFLQRKCIIDIFKKIIYIIQVRNYKIYLYDVSSIRIHILLLIVCASSSISMKKYISKIRD